MKKLYLLLALIALICSCEKSENPVPEENEENIPPASEEIVISDSYLPLTQQNSTCTAYDTLSGAVEMYISDTTLVPKIGNVIVVDLDTLGVIRRIKSVENLKSGNYRFTTEYATMGDIFEKGIFALSTSSEPSTKAGIPIFKPVEMIFRGNDSTLETKGEIQTRLITAEVDLSRSFQTFFTDDPNKEGCPISLGAGSKISSSLDLTMQFNFDNTLDLISKFSNNLVEFKAWLEGDVEVGVNVGVSAEKEYEWSKDKKLVDNFFKPVLVKFIVSGVPIYVDCETDLYGELSASIGGKCEASVGAKCNLNGKSGIEYIQSAKSCKSFNDFSISAEPIAPTLSGEVSLKNSLSIYPRVTVFLYSLIGPVLDVKPFLSHGMTYGAEVNLVDKKDKIAPVLSYLAETGINIAGKLHLNPFDKSGVKDIVALDINLKTEIYRSPHKIEKKEVKKVDGGEKKVVFAVYDTLPSKKSLVPTPIPIPVVVTKSSTNNKQSSDNSSAPAKKSFEVKQVAEGKIEVPVDRNTSVVEEVKQTINADLYSNNGTIISNASHEEIVESDLREILIAFYESTDGDNWINNDNWCSEEPIETWYGINFITDSTFVLELNSNNLKGDAVLSGCTSLEELECYNNQLTSLSVSECTSLRLLECDNNQLTSLSVSGCTSLRLLYCGDNQLTSLDLTGSTSLEDLICNNSQLTSLNVSGCTSLKQLYYPGGQLTSLDVSGCTSLEDLRCELNQLTSLDLTGCTSLAELDCYNNQLTSLDLTGCTSLSVLRCYNNQLTSLDVSGCTSLEYLLCYDNQLTSLDVSGCTSLEYLWCQNNQLTSLDVSGYTSLEELRCNYNQLTSLSVSGCTSLRLLYCYNNQLTSLDVSGYTSLESLVCNNNQLTSLDVSGCTSLKQLYYPDGQLTSLDVSGCTSLESLVCNNNQLTSLDLTGCTSLADLDCDKNQLTSLNVSGCTSLADLDCYNNQLTSLDLKDCASLAKLDCSTNQLTSLDVSGYTSLETLGCNNNQLTSLDVSGCTSLEELECYNNQLTSLSVSECTSLRLLYCDNNQLTSLSVSGCASLAGLRCYNNQLTSLDVSGCTSLEWLECHNNQLTSLDVSGCISLEDLWCYNNQLTSLDLTGCTSLNYLECTSNKITSVIPNYLIDVWNRFRYDCRYYYEATPNGDTKVIDKGKGWWYPGEPERGYHGK